MKLLPQKKHFILSVFTVVLVLFVLFVEVSFYYLKTRIAVAIVNSEEPAVVLELKQKIQEKEKEVAQLEREAEQYRSSIEQNISEQRTLQNQLKAIDKEIKTVNYNITITQKRLEATEMRIQELSYNIGLTKKSIEENTKQVAELLNLFQVADGNDQLSMFLSVERVSDFFDQLAYLDNLQQKILEKIDFLRVLHHALEGDLNISEQTRRQYSQLKNTLDAQKTIALDKKTERKAILEETKNQERFYQQLLAEVIRKQKQIEAEIEKLEQELRKRIDFGKIPEHRPGLFLWPVGGGYLTQGYGPIPSGSPTRKFYSFHNGIDIGAKTRTGTPIFAADNGVVKAVGNNGRYAYGKWVAIEHQYGFTTLYAHLSLISVRPGQQVNRGEVIGYMGDTGLSFGPHLHFTVYTSESFRVENRWFGLLPIGASVDPNSYL